MIVGRQVLGVKWNVAVEGFRGLCYLQHVQLAYASDYHALRVKVAGLGPKI